MVFFVSLFTHYPISDSNAYLVAFTDTNCFAILTYSAVMKSYQAIMVTRIMIVGFSAKSPRSCFLKLATVNLRKQRVMIDSHHAQVLSFGIEAVISS